MFGSLVRRISHHRVLKKMNREMRFEESKQYFESLQHTDSINSMKCKEQYYISLKYLNLLKEESAKSTNTANLIAKDVKQSLVDIDTIIGFCTYLGLFLVLTKLVKKIKGGDIDEMSSLLRPEENFRFVEHTKFTFNDVKGIDDCREELEDIVQYLRNPEVYKRSGAQLTKGVLLTGSPGTGKTLLAKAIAGEAGVKFFYSSGSDFEEMFVGVGAQRVRKLFKSAKKNAPSIVFIDEIDAIASSRSGIAGLYTKQSLNQLLVEMDGFSPNDQVVVIAATNFPESLDPAIKRSGRFDKIVHIPVPDLKGRTEILELYLGKVATESSIKAKDIALKTLGMTGAEIQNIVNLAALHAVRSGRLECNAEDFEHSLDRVKIGMAARTYTMTEQEKLTTIYHELGHAIVGFFTKGAGEIHKVTILPRGQTLGHTSVIDTKESKARTREEILAHIDVCMGGRAAEEVFFGQDSVTSGCSSDLSNATRAAYYGIRSGLFAEIGGCAGFKDIEELGEEQRNRVDKMAISILESSYFRAKKIIEGRVELMKKMAEMFKESDTITREEFARAAKELSL